ncbi:MAG: hypothetical protein J2P25_16690, partial [Nocardiopsaceae bacterium]|nr:hypothetical protein [Nocardiopsaceae bacterium]
MAPVAVFPRPPGSGRPPGPGRRLVPGRVLIVGTGLIGTSVALALRARGVAVWLNDVDADSAALAAGLGAGTVVDDLRDAKGVADVAV